MKNQLFKTYKNFANNRADSAYTWIISEVRQNKAEMKF